MNRRVFFKSAKTLLIGGVGLLYLGDSKNVESNIKLRKVWRVTKEGEYKRVRMYELKVNDYFEFDKIGSRRFKVIYRPFLNDRGIWEVKSEGPVLCHRHSTALIEKK